MNSYMECLTKKGLNPKRVCYIGNRHFCYEVLYNNPKYNVIKVLTFENSSLQKYLDNVKQDYELINETDNEYVISVLLKLEYDILVCNGSPFFLPASKLRAQGKILLNTHPTYLPYMRGKRPINGVLLYHCPIGEKTHFMSDIIDGGNIIYQKKISWTPDIDLGLCYYISFNMQTDVFKNALMILEKHNYQYKGKKMDLSGHPIFRNEPDLRILNFQEMSSDDCLKHIKAYGVTNEGCLARINDKNYCIYDGENIVNRYLLHMFAKTMSGEIILCYDTCILVKCKKGILKITKYSIYE